MRPAFTIAPRAARRAGLGVLMIAVAMAGGLVTGSPVHGIDVKLTMEEARKILQQKQKEHQLLQFLDDDLTGTVH